MKKNISLVLAIVLCNLFVQGQSDYLSKINLDSVKTNVDSKLSKLLLDYKFPKNYEKTLETKIAEFEYNKTNLNFKYAKDLDTKNKKIDSLKVAFEEWTQTQTKTSKKAEKHWNATFTKHNLDEEIHKKNFINYHFYIGLENPTQYETLQIEQLAKSKNLKNSVNTIAKNETQRVLERCTNIKKLDSVAFNYAGKALYKHLKSKTLEKLNSRAVIKLTRDSGGYCLYALEVVNIKQEERKAKKSAKKNETFVKNAIAAGINEDIANTILDLIQKRKTDLKALKNNSNDTESLSELFENTARKTKSEIKKEFAQDLAQLVDRTQFAKLFNAQFIDIVTNKTQERMVSLKAEYKLKKDQETKISKMIKTFYFNQEISKAYYSFDKKLKKQKLSALRFRFEKKFKELMSSFNLKANPAKKLDEATFLWD